MSTLNSFFVSFCVSAILLGSFFIICPDGQITKSVKNIFSLLFTLIIISSALSIKLDLNYSFDALQNNDTVTGIDTSGAIYVYSECLKSAEIEFTEISVLTTKNDDGSIIISKVLIFSKAEKNEILNALSVVAQNIEVEIINE